MKITKEQILGKLKTIQVPESNQTVADIVKEINISKKNIIVEAELDKKSMPLKNSLEKVIKSVISELAGKDVKIKLVITEGLQLQKVKINTDKPLSGVKNIIAVASGKGGVGKSTVAVNLAVALHKNGAKVGILDADVYGPSIPKMFGVENEKPHVKKINNKDLIIPIEKYGLKMLSIGFFVEPDNALIWRGAMATGALKQLINDTDWGELDYLILDLPPGTGDIHLTIVQTIPVTGAVIVTTPQDIAIADAIKGISMFNADKIEVPILGIIENMSWFTPAELPDNKYYIFGRNGGKKVADKYNVKLLGQIPIVQSIRENGDIGKPSVLDFGTKESKAFLEIAQNMITSIKERNKNKKATKIVEITEK